MRLGGRVSIVTGGASGIGLAIATAFADEGASVVLADVDENAGKDAEARLRKQASCLFVVTDVGKRFDCRRLIEETVREFGRIDILVNNAGFQHVASIADFDEDTWDKMINVMLTGTFLCTKYALPCLSHSPFGRIINISSIHGMVASKYKSAYVAAKHGVVGFTKVLALETAEKGTLTANAVCPSYVRTALLDRQLESQARLHGISREEVIEKILLADSPIKRVLEPEEVAQLCVYLAGDAAKNITGAALMIDAGWTAR